MNRKIFFVTCGPTGIGKTYQMQRCIEEDPMRYTAVRSVTTRKRREGEDEMWYRFVTHEDIQAFDPSDVISTMTFRGEEYVLLRSEIDAAFTRAPAAFMAIVPSVIERLRQLRIAHIVLNCHVGNVEAYTERLRQRGYTEDTLRIEVTTGLEFPYPREEPGWIVEDIQLGFADDTARVNAAIRKCTDLYAAGSWH